MPQHHRRAPEGSQFYTQDLEHEGLSTQHLRHDIEFAHVVEMPVQRLNQAVDELQDLVP